MNIASVTILNVINILNFFFMIRRFPCLVGDYGLTFLQIVSYPSGALLCAL